MKIVKSRIDAVLPLLKGKSVLSIGCVGMGSNDTYGGKDFHLGRSVETAKEVVGLDINRRGISFLKGKGFNVVYGSADEPFTLNRKFDVVLAEEVIEHLSDLRVFLTNCREHMNKGGMLIISSPNPFAFELFLQRILFGKELTNDHHTHWQSEKTMSYLLKRNGFKPVKIIHVESEAENTRGRIFQSLFQWLPKRFSRNIFYVATRT